jgi:hypothetical protein
MEYTKGYLLAAHQYSSWHRKDVIKSDVCGCFYCLATFGSSEINDWVDEDTNLVEQTALCPKCNIDAVIGEASGLPITDKNFLIQMADLWFS